MKTLARILAVFAGLISLFAVCAIPGTARAATEIWVCTDFTGMPLVYKKVSLYPDAVYTNGFYGYAALDGRTFYTDATGTVYFTNLTVGSYVANLQSVTNTMVGFTITNYFSTNYITTNSTVQTNTLGALAVYTVSAANQLFARLNGSSLTGNPQVISNSVTVSAGNNVTISTDASGLQQINASGSFGGSSNYVTLFTGSEVVSNNLFGGNGIFEQLTASNGFVGSATSATNFTGSLTGDVTGTQGATVASQVGGVSAANVASGATAANNATTNNTPSAIVLRSGGGIIAYPAMMSAVYNPTNTFTSTATYSGVQNNGALMVNNILTSSAGGFDTTGTNITGMALGPEWSITFNGSDQYIVDKVIDSTHAYVHPPFVHTYSSLTGVCDRPCAIYKDNTGAYQGGARSGGGEASAPIWGNTLFTLWNNNGTNSFYFAQGNIGNPFEAGMLSIRSAWNYHDALNFAPSVNANTLDLIGGALLNFGGATVSHFTNFQNSGTIQIDVPFIGAKTFTNLGNAGVGGTFVVGGGETNTSASGYNGVGSGLTALSAGNISSGTVATARLGTGGTANTLLHGNQIFSGVDLSADVINALAVGNGGLGNGTGNASSLNNIPAGQLTGTVANARLNIGFGANDILALDSGANLDATGGGAISIDGNGGLLQAINGADFISATLSTENAVTAMTLTVTNAATFKSTITGNGAGITGMMATSHSWTNYNVPSGSGTNFIVNASGPQNASCLVSNDFVIVGFTNGPGNSIALHLLDMGTTNHNLMFPTAWQLYGMTNVVSTTKGTNSLVVLTNTVWASLVIASLDGTANPVATNTAIYIGVSH